MKEKTRREKNTRRNSIRGKYSRKERRKGVSVRKGGKEFLDKKNEKN